MSDETDNSALDEAVMTTEEAIEYVAKRLGCTREQAAQFLLDHPEARIMIQ